MSQFNKGYVPPHARRGSLRSQNYNRAATGIASSQEDLERRRQRFCPSAQKPDIGYGLLSRGEDNRLQRDPEARKTFFDKIRKEFAESFSTYDLATLSNSMKSLSMEENDAVSQDPSKATSEEAQKLSHVMMSLRKLREALLNSEPDDFCKNVFLFSIRISSRIGLHQTYIPSINYLLKNRQILNKSELREISNIYILHLSHFNNADQLALQEYFKYAKDDIRLGQILVAWRNKDYIKWFDLYHTEKDISRHKMMSFGEPTMVLFTMKCIQRAYFQLPRSYVERLFFMNVEELQKRFNCNWVLEGDIVMIRLRK